MNNFYKTLTIAFLSAFVFGLVMQSIPPILPILIEEMGLSHTQGGALMSLFALPGIFFSIPGGVLADFYGPRKIGIYSLLIMFAGMLIVATGTSYTTLALGRFIAGIGGTTIIIIAAQSISGGFEGNKSRGIGLGIFNAGVPAGVIFSLNVFNRLAVAWDNWQLPVLVSAFFCLVVLLLLWRYREFETAFNSSEEKANFHKKGRPDYLESFRNLGSYGSIWIVGLIWFLFMCARTAALTFGPDFFISVGYGYAYAGFLASLFTLGSLYVSPLAGYIIDKTGKTELYLITGGIILVLLHVLLVTSPWHFPIAFVIGVVGALFPFSVFYFVPLLLPQEKLGKGLGVLRICENAGILIGPFFVGLIYDLTISYFYCFMLISAFFLGTLASSIALKISLKKTPLS